MRREKEKNPIFNKKNKAQIIHSDLLEQYFNTLNDIFDICILTNENEVIIKAASTDNIEIHEQKTLLQYVDFTYKNEYAKAISVIRKEQKSASFNLRLVRLSKIYKVKCVVVKNEDNEKYLLFLFLDNTKLNELNASLLNYKDRFRTIVNYTASWESWISPSGDLLFINPAVKDITGYSFEESIWLFQYPKRYIYKEDSKRVVNKFIQALKQEKSGTDIFRLIKKDKTLIWMSSQWNPVYGNDGDYQGLRLSLHDITTIKETQKLLEENLAQFIKVNGELKEANNKIEETARAGEIFIANMSHFVRTPLNAILGMAELLYSFSLGEEQTEMVEIIEHSAESLLTVINDIVDIKKFETNKIKLDYAGFNLYEKTKAVFTILKEEARKKNLKYTFHYPEQFKKLIVKSDADRLSQIIFNLLNNAIKYTYKGSVRFEIMIKEISNSFELDFTISDTGIGITEENKLNIFEGFSTRETQVAKKIEGSGLGLYISKKLVEMMHGTIKVSSVAGRGSVFSLHFSFEKGIIIETPDRKNFKLNIKEKQKKLQNISILLVEDQEFNQILIKKITDYWMCNLDTATNGQNAIDMLNKKSYDIVLMDIQLPVMSGLQATNIIRNKMHEPIKSIPIVALTANALEGDYEKYKAAGMNDYLAKPFQSQELYNMIVKNLKSEKQSQHSERVVVEKNVIKNATYSLKKILELAKGDESYVIEMIRVFINQCVEIKDDMRKSLKKGNTSELGELAHKLKSSVNIMCLTNIEKPVFKLVEFARKNIEKKQIISLTEFIITELESIISVFTTELTKRSL